MDRLSTGQVMLLIFAIPIGLLVGALLEAWLNLL